MRYLAVLLGVFFVVTACGSTMQRSRSSSEPGGYSVAAVRAAFAGQGIHFNHALGPPTGGGFALLTGRRSHRVRVAVYEVRSPKARSNRARAERGPSLVRSIGGIGTSSSGGIARTAEQSLQHSPRCGSEDADVGACALWCLVMDGSVGGDGWSRLAQGGTRQGAPARPRCASVWGGFLHLNVQRNSGGCWRVVRWGAT